MRQDPKDMNRSQLDETRGGKAAEAFSRFVNGADEHDIKCFVEYFHREHRTLQQNATRAMLCWFYSLADSDRGSDLRNEASVTVSKIIKETLGDYGHHLPRI